MRLLVLGGTLFLGRHVVEDALARGHDITLFNRGRTHAELFPTVAKVHGERDGGIDLLRGDSWDAVVDTSGYLPRVVRASASLLAPSAAHYAFVSTVSVYSDFSRGPIGEDDPVGRLEDPSIEQVTGETYGPLKALCEEAVLEEFPGRAAIVRPGLIVGPFDPSDRFTYWVRRVARGGDVLAPGKPERPVQFVDVRDLASWILDMSERKAAGTFNACGPEQLLTMGNFLGHCIRVSKSDANLVWIDDKALVAAGAGPWMEVPMWIPETEESMSGLMAVNSARAIARGIRFRPVADTILDTLEWDSQRGDSQLSAGMSSERERELLQTTVG